MTLDDPQAAVVNPNWPIRAQLAQYEGTAVNYLEQLASDPIPAVRQAIALNPNCPPELLSRLAVEAEEVGRNGGTVLKRRVALHPNVPEATLVELATSDDTSILMAVGRNPKLTVEMAKNLVSTGNRHAILCVATNPNLSDATKRSVGVEPLPPIAASAGLDRAVRHFESWANETPWNLRTRTLFKTSTPPAETPDGPIPWPVGMETMQYGQSGTGS
ncbi:MAG TPA: hypothetical protein VGS21_06695 [Acidimicrobiales bacterium]|nr:hypothetical protein [Acidimicrobiales bacterium]